MSNKTLTEWTQAVECQPNCGKHKEKAIVSSGPKDLPQSKEPNGSIGEMSVCESEAGVNNETEFNEQVVIGNFSKGFVVKMSHKVTWDD